MTPRQILEDLLGVLCVFAIPYLFALIAYGLGAE
jgi:hypothetical protein